MAKELTEKEHIEFGRSLDESEVMNASLKPTGYFPRGHNIKGDIRDIGIEVEIVDCYEEGPRGPRLDRQKSRLFMLDVDDDHYTTIRVLGPASLLECVFDHFEADKDSVEANRYSLERCEKDVEGEFT